MMHFAVPAANPPLPDYFDATVQTEYLIRCYNRQVFRQSLRDELPVKKVGVLAGNRIRIAKAKVDVRREVERF
jgi:hypothetical protein